MKLEDVPDKTLCREFRVNCDDLMGDLAALKRAVANNESFEKVDRRFNSVQISYDCLKKLHAEMARRHIDTMVTVRKVDEKFQKEFAEID